jgi:hypothetical protein
MVECGVWRGGSSIAMLLAQREFLGHVERPVYMFDSFEGLPPAAQADGPLAKRWQHESTLAQSFNNCTATRAEVQSSLDSLRFAPEDYRIVPGWFEDTLPRLAVRLANEKISLLRLDGDWYESTRTCLEYLMPAVSVNGVIIIDDYYAWDGCARAVHEYLSKHDLPYRIRSLPGFLGAYFVKKPHRDDASTLDDGVDLGGSLMCSISNREYYLELEQAKSWLDQQRQSWHNLAEERERDLKKCVAAIEDLENAKLWLEEQRQNWQRLAEERERSLADSVASAHELEAANTWLEQQRETWQHLAEERERTLGQALANARELEERKLALEEQRESWQRFTEAQQ